MVTILVPVYNAAPYIRQCVESLIGQTYTDLQIVMINDGSTDESWDIMKELAQQDKRIEVYSKANAGVASTRNQLLDKVRGDWALFVDSDDWIDHDTIEVLLQEQAATGADMVVFNYPVNGQLNREQVIEAFLRHKTFRGMLWNKLIKSDLLKDLYFDQTVSYGEDALMVWHILQRVNSVSMTDRVMYHYRIHQDSLSRQTFNGKKFTAYTVWNSICNDVDEVLPRYREIAHARFACEMTQVLLSAAQNNHRHDKSVSLLQEEVRRDSHLIAKTKISSKKMSLYAWLVSHNYWLARKLSPFIKK